MYNNIMQLPRISVIVPVYNTKDYLFDCLSSLKNQTYKNLEILLIDDGSTDDSLKIIQKYQKLDSRARVLKKKNGGLSSARNLGLDHANGEYIFFLDSDDYLENDAIEYLYFLIKKTNSPLSMCSHYERKGNDKLKDFNNGGGYKSQKLTVETALDRMLNEQGFTMSAWGKLYKTDLFKKHKSLEKIRFPESKLHEDVGTTYKLLLRVNELNKNSRIVFGEKPKYIYNIRKTSITNQGFNNKKLELITQTDEMCDAIDKSFPNLRNATNLRRLHARFSILRQIIQKTHKTENDKKLEDSLVYYIKSHKSWISENPESTKRDKLALASLMAGRTAFRIAWSLYSKFFK